MSKHPNQTISELDGVTPGDVRRFYDAVLGGEHAVEKKVGGPEPVPTTAEWLSTAQAAAYLQLGNTSSIRSLVARKALKPDGKNGRTYLFRKATLDAYVTRGTDNLGTGGRSGGRPGQDEANPAPRRVPAAGRKAVGTGSGAASGRQGGDAPASDADRGKRVGRHSGRAGTEAVDQKPAAAGIDRYAPPPGYVPTPTA